MRTTTIVVVLLLNASYPVLIFFTSAFSFHCQGTGSSQRRSSLGSDPAARRGATSTLRSRARGNHFWGPRSLFNMVTLPSSTAPSALVEDAHPWDVYRDMMLRIMTCDGIVNNKRVKKLTTQELRAAQEYLLSNCTLISRQEDTNPVRGDTFRETLRNQRDKFFQVSGFTDHQHEYCTSCLTYLGDMSAKRQAPDALRYGWHKIQEIGMMPRENCVSTYIYVLGLSPQTCSDEAYEAAYFHDQLFQPNEKTITLRTKTLVARGDARGAEQILATLPDKGVATAIDRRHKTVEWKRLRTFQPLLSYYCDQRDVPALLRLFRQMQQSEGVYIDAETYAMVLATLARCGCFIANPSPSSSSVTLDHGNPDEVMWSNGPSFFDEFCSEMANDLLELNEAAATVIWSGLKEGLKSAGIERVNCITRCPLVVDRVTVDNTTGLCPATGTKLRLLALTTAQRRTVHDTLLQLAETQQREYGDKYRSKVKARDEASAICARQDLAAFSNWLQTRSGEPYTAIVDGPNVCFYGHNTIHYSQVKAVFDELHRIGETPLIIMPSKYIDKSFWVPSLGGIQELKDRDLAIMNELLESGKMYSVPATCLDDYYWMIASVANQTDSAVHKPPQQAQGGLPGLRPLLVTNDQMRDHKRSLVRNDQFREDTRALLEPRDFRRWTSCHIVKYDFAPYTSDEWETRQVTFFPADGFSREIQGNLLPNGKVDGGSLVWHFPVTEWPEPDRFCVYIPSS